MSGDSKTILSKAVAALSERVGSFDGAVKFAIVNVGQIIVNRDGVHVGDGPAACTLSASAETFQAILSGRIHPVNAFISGKLKVEGEMDQLTKLGRVLG